MNIEDVLRKASRRGRRLGARRVWDAVDAQAETLRRARLSDVRKVHVGCGPHNRLEGWHNVDIKPFASVDTPMDVTKSWPFAGLEYIYSEHFLEHLALLDGVRFLEQGGQTLRPGGKMRLSTPNLHWVMLTHFRAGEVELEERLADTFNTNRAFHGWGHQFLYTEEILRFLLEGMGYESVSFEEYGKSEDPTFVGLERHGGYTVVDGQPSVVIVEARRGAAPIVVPDTLWDRLKTDYQRYVDAA